MKHLFKPETIKKIIILLVLLLLVKLFWFFVQKKWLPAAGVGHTQTTSTKALYYRVKLTPNEATAPREPKKEAQKNNIKDIKLLAIYNASDATVVTIEYKGKTKVLSKGDEVDGFKLEKADNMSATFSKNGRTYRVKLLTGKHTSSISAQDEGPSTFDQEMPPPQEGGVRDAGDHKIIDKELLTHYANNMDDIYKNIGISEVRSGNSLKGFRITYVRKDSPFEKLGIRRGDTVKSINGQEINSYNAAFDLYKNLKSMDGLSLVIIRENEEMELEYEIN